MFDFLGTHYGAVSAGIICLTLIFLIIFLSKRFSGVEIADGKVKISNSQGVQTSKSPTLHLTIIRDDDWKVFATQLYEFCIVLMKPRQNCMYSILHCFDNDISPSKKMYVERFLYFNHIPENGTKLYARYINAHTNAIIASVCRSIKFICSEYDKEIGEYNADKLAKSLSDLIEKYREVAK